MRYIFTILFSLLSLFASNAYSAEFGFPDGETNGHTVTEGKKLNVRARPSKDATLIYQLRPYDRVYFDTDSVYQGDGEEWMKVTAKWGSGPVMTGYVTNLHRFSGLEKRTEDFEAKVEKIRRGSQRGAKMVAIALAVLFAAGAIAWYFHKDPKVRILGKKEKGMRRIFFLNPAPYKSILIITLALICGTLAAVGLLLAIGGGSYGILWTVKIICSILNVIGYILIVVAVIGVFTKHAELLLFGALGLLIVACNDDIVNFGNKCEDIGKIFLQEVDITDYFLQLLRDNWIPIFIFLFLPLALFLSLASIWLLGAGILIGIEKIMTNRYNIHHPCPHCQQPSEPARYLSKSEAGYLELPNKIRLRPGAYGLLHITHPVTGEKMPTTLLNGRDRLPRLCANCGKKIQANEGTDLHIALVGAAMAGKSTLTLRLLAEMMKNVGEINVSFSDTANTMRDKSIPFKVKWIANNGYISTDQLPNKTAVSDTASLQVNISRRNSKIPYRLFINDVGGELYDSSNRANGENRTRFFRNVDSILFVVDPLSTDLSDCDPSQRFIRWERNTGGARTKLPLRQLMDTVDNQLAQYHRNPKDVDINIIFPKIDLGYIPADYDITSSASLQEFAENELGLSSLLYWARKFRTFSLFAISATTMPEEANISPLYYALFHKQLRIGAS